jgi:hypothetical protein
MISTQVFKEKKPGTIHGYCIYILCKLIELVFSTDVVEMLCDFIVAGLLDAKVAVIFHYNDIKITLVAIYKY